MATHTDEPLVEQLAALQARIRRDAANVKLRIHLFQLLCVMGDWPRALAQLQLCGQLDAKALAMAQTYREAIRCERFREAVFNGKRAPQVMGQPPAWIGGLIDALRHDGAGDYAAASALRSQAMELAEPRSCTADGVACEWFADGDSRLGPVCEVFANGQYFWLPFESCQGLQLEAPVDLRDLVWASGELLLPNAGRVPVLIPARYAGTASSTAPNADALKQARMTEWTEVAPGMWFGAGQRLWTSDGGEHPILDLRSLNMTAGAVAAPVMAP